MRRGLMAALVALVLPAAVWADSPVSYLQLQDRLDRPQDGYCLDVVGAGSSFRLDMPLTAHNCKPGNAPDGLVVLQEDGRLYMPAFDGCVTAMGVARTLLPGAALMLRPCGDGASFAQSIELQTFDLQDDGTLRTRDLCLTVGPASGPTFSRSHHWRPLFVDTCSADAAPRQQWSLIAPFGTG